MRLVDLNGSGEINQTASLPAGVTLLSICYVGIKLNWIICRPATVSNPSSFVV